MSVYCLFYATFTNIVRLNCLFEVASVAEDLG